jgi:hypothetical protein
MHVTLPEPLIKRSSPRRRAPKELTTPGCIFGFVTMELQDLLGVRHRRFSPLTRDWILVSPHRTQRPWQGQVETSASPSLSAYEANCYSCPGNERAKGSEVIGCWSSSEDYKTLGETGPSRVPYPVLIRKNPSAFTDHGDSWINKGVPRRNEWSRIALVITAEICLCYRNQSCGFLAYDFCMARRRLL